MVKKAMAEAFAVVMEVFRDVTLKDSAVLESVGRQVHGVTGGQMREFAERLRVAASRPLTEEQILAWADAHHQQSGEWPQSDSGSVVDSPWEKWQNLDAVLRVGLRALPGGSSLAQLLAENRGVRNVSAPPRLTEDQILIWADAHHARTGKWPKQNSGPIPEAPGETWTAVELSLGRGSRSLPGGSSLARLLAEKRGRRNHLDLPPLSVEQILQWADAHYLRTGTWPTSKPGPIVEAPRETWQNIDAALKVGCRKLPGGKSLARLLAENRRVRNVSDLPRLSVEQILEWVDEYHERTGNWPKTSSGSIANTPGETWKIVDRALVQCGRGLVRRSSLAQLLVEKRGVTHPKAPRLLSIDQILAWADAHRDRTGRWPSEKSGVIVEAPNEKWVNVQAALRLGLRGLPGGSSLVQLLEANRGKTNQRNLPPLTESQILAWADMYTAAVREPTLIGRPSLWPLFLWRLDHHGRNGILGEQTVFDI